MGGPRIIDVSRIKWFFVCRENKYLYQTVDEILAIRQLEDLDNVLSASKQIYTKFPNKCFTNSIIEEYPKRIAVTTKTEIKRHQLSIRVPWTALAPVNLLCRKYF